MTRSGRDGRGRAASSLCCATASLEVSSAVATLLQSLCWLQASVLLAASSGRAPKKGAVSPWKRLVCTSYAASMDSHSAQAPPQHRQKQKPQKATEPMPKLGLHRVEPRPVATQPPSPPRRPILWREAPKLWRDEKPPKKKQKLAPIFRSAASSSAPSPSPSSSASNPVALVDVADSSISARDKCPDREAEGWSFKNTTVVKKGQTRH